MKQKPTDCFLVLFTSSVSVPMTTCFLFCLTPLFLNPTLMENLLSWWSATLQKWSKWGYFNCFNTNNALFFLTSMHFIHFNFFFSYALGDTYIWRKKIWDSKLGSHWMHAIHKSFYVKRHVCRRNKPSSRVTQQSNSGISSEARGIPRRIYVLNIR